MTHRLIDEELYQGICKYLATRPYQEIAPAMPPLLQAMSIDVPKLLEASPEFADWYKKANGKA